MNISNDMDPMRVVAHLDSSFFVIGKRANLKGQWDLFLLKHTINKPKPDFDTSLNLIQLFGGKLDPNTFLYSVFNTGKNLMIMFDVKLPTERIAVCKVIEYNGKVSDAYILEKEDLKNENLDLCYYSFSLTPKKDLLINLNRIYKSGFRRDKITLYDHRLSKLWAYDFPKINAHEEINLISDIYNSDQVLHAVVKGRTGIVGMNYETNTLIADSAVKMKVLGLTYNTWILKDSIEFLISKPAKNETKTVKIYWPYSIPPIVNWASSTQIILHNMVNIDDESANSPSKKALYYKRVDVKNNITLFDSLVVFDRMVQENLTYFNNDKSRPTAKNFLLLFSKTADGKLFSVYRQQMREDGEMFACCFDIIKNKVCWANLIPQRTTSVGEFNTTVVNYANKKFGLGFYEHKKNLDMPQYIRKKYELLKRAEDANFIYTSISEDGTMSKKLVEKVDDAFLFPWLGDNYTESGDKFFWGRHFMPKDYISTILK